MFAKVQYGFLNGSSSQLATKSKTEDVKQVSSASAAAPKSPWSESKRSLGYKFTPGPHDVICARGKGAFNHAGNKRFRQVVESYCTKYKNVQSKIERSAIVSDIIDSIRKFGSGFIKQEETTGEWFEVGDTIAREKVGQHFRNKLGYKSSFKIKKDRRKAATSLVSERVEKIVLENERVKNVVNVMDNSCRHSGLSDEQVMRLFDFSNAQVLHHIKTDTSMLGKYHAAMIEESTKGRKGEKEDKEEKSTVEV